VIGKKFINDGPSGDPRGAKDKSIFASHGVSGFGWSWWVLLGCRFPENVDERE
jgi:hypothetical protein